MSRLVPRFHRNNPPGTPIGGGGICRYKIVGSIEGQLTVSSFDYVSTVPSLTAAQLLTMVTNLSAQVMVFYRACLSADWSLTYERIDMVHVNNIQGVTYLGGLPASGQRAAGHEPTEVSQPIIKYTALKGQHGRGRISLPAISTADVTSSKISAAAEITAIQTLCAKMILTVSDGTNTWTPCVSTRSPVTKLAAFFTSTVVCTQSPLLGTIRRRKIGRGK